MKNENFLGSKWFWLDGIEVTQKEWKNDPRVSLYLRKENMVEKINKL